LFIINYNLFATWLINDCSVRTCTLSSILAQIRTGKAKIELKSKLGYALTILSFFCVQQAVQASFVPSHSV